MTPTQRRSRSHIRVAIPIAAVVLLAISGAHPANVPRGRQSTGDAFRLTRSGPAPLWWAAASTTDSKCWVVKRDEQGFARKMNLARQAVGKRKLSLDPELSKVARKHTREMVDRDLLYHTSSDALRRRVTHWAILGENVGVGSAVDSLHAAFMASPGHKENILYTSFRHVGVGTKPAGGRLWVTVIFQARDDPGTTLRMPRC